MFYAKDMMQFATAIPSSVDLKPEIQVKKRGDQRVHIIFRM